MFATQQQTVFISVSNKVEGDDPHAKLSSDLCMCTVAGMSTVGGGVGEEGLVETR